LRLRIGFALAAGFCVWGRVERRPEKAEVRVRIFCFAEGFCGKSTTIASLCEGEIGAKRAGKLAELPRD
jgi:hypothetical protein